MTANTAKEHRSSLAFNAGCFAEQSVARHYERRGYHLAHTRWRSPAGEIDLILRFGAKVIFVEVKKSASFAKAAQRVSPRQKQRIYVSAEVFLETEPAGTLAEARFDVALVNGCGEIEIVENAFDGG